MNYFRQSTALSISKGIRIIGLITLITFLISCSGKSPKLQDLPIKNGRYYDQNKLAPYSGKAVDSTDRFRYSEGEMLEGMKSGKWKLYEQRTINKQRKWVYEGFQTFDSGRLSGYCEGYSSSGERVSKTNYRKGKKHGEFVHFYKGGDTSSVYHYKMGMRHGRSAGYTEAGAKTFVTGYKLDKLHGPDSMWLESTGMLLLCRNYINGVRHGLTTEFYKTTGKRQVETVYDAGRETEVTWFNDDGTPMPDFYEHIQGVWSSDNFGGDSLNTSILTFIDVDLRPDYTVKLELKESKKMEDALNEWFATKFNVYNERTMTWSKYNKQTGEIIGETRVGEYIMDDEHILRTGAIGVRYIHYLDSNTFRTGKGEVFTRIY